MLAMWRGRQEQYRNWSWRTAYRTRVRISDTKGTFWSRGDVVWRLVTKRISVLQRERVWSGLSWLRIGNHEGPCETKLNIMAVTKRRISRLAEKSSHILLIT